MAVAAASLAGGCADSPGGSYGGSHPDYRSALRGSPAPLAGLQRQANRLLAGGKGAFARRLAGLRGYPVVVNKWASWCGPCRAEFPLLQRAAARYGKRVAFLGVDSKDFAGSARTFLGEYPVPYPSYLDPGEDIAQSFRATIGFPATAFYDRSGRLAYVKQGGYADQAVLDADIKRHALRSG